ncbi:MAG: hypothetical protein P9L94_02650 [Candidatus Hinthialibacter antarcticus]|nr:hypothetical protein [Candidatus Hinthialibacter antarcticus]
MNDQPDTSVSKAMQESLKNYLKELWNALWIVVWGVLWYQYYENVNPYNQADQLILAIVSLFVLMNFLRECSVRIDNIFFMSGTWLMLIFGALLPNQSYEWIQPVLGYAAILFLFRIFASRKDFMDDFLKDARTDESKNDSNGDDKNGKDKMSESKL